MREIKRDRESKKIEEKEKSKSQRQNEDEKETKEKKKKLCERKESQDARWISRQINVENLKRQNLTEDNIDRANGWEKKKNAS